MEEGDGGGGDTTKSQPTVSGERRHSRRPSESTKTKCLRGSCFIDEKENNIIQCDKCEKSFHYRCTGLPAYQIQHFVHTKKYKKYICESCTPIADHLKTVIPSPPPPDPNEKVQELERIIKEKQVEVDTLAETNRILQAEIKDLSSKNTDIQASLDKEKAKHATLQSRNKEMKTGIVAKDEKIVSLENSLKEKANGDSLPEILAKKIEEVESKLMNSFQTEVSKNQKQMEDKMNEFLEKSYAAVAGNATSQQNNTGADTPAINGIIHVPDLRSIMREQENEKLADETDKKRRACNFIVHGVGENVASEEEKEQSKQKDKDFINKLIRYVGLEFEIKSIFRIGAIAATDKKRPIKVTLDGEENKSRLLGNLRNLKGNGEYKGISVTDDYTQKDRTLLKEWAEKAKAKNDEEPDESVYEWKVRGCPKNGLSLRKFRKRDLQAQA